MKIYNFNKSGRGPGLRWGGNHLVQWAILVWIAVVLLEYFNRDLGFRPLLDLFR